MNRSLLIFEAACRSEYTKRTYKFYLNKFLEFVMIKDHDKLLTLKTGALQEKLEDYVLYLKNRVSPNSLQTMTAPLELFFSMNDRILNWKKIKKLFPATIKRTGAEAWTTEDIKKMLEYMPNKRNKAIIHFIASTGCRSGALSELTMKNISIMRGECKAITFYEGTKEEYIGFLTPEASIVLDEYLKQREQSGEHINESSPLFRKNYSIAFAPANPLTKGIVERIIRTAIEKAGLRRMKTGARYNIQTDHGFRKRFNTILKSNDKANPSLVEKLMGHQGVFALDGSYLRPSLETLFDEFKKHILEMTIDNSERDKIKLRNLEQKTSESEKSRIAMEDMKKRIEKLEYGAEARKSTYAKNMLRFRQQKDRVGEVLSMLSHYLFERERTEEEKREFLKRIKKAKENGEEMDDAWVLEALGVSVEDLENAENLLRDNPRVRNILSEFIQTVIQKGRNFDNYSLPALLAV